MHSRKRNNPPDATALQPVRQGPAAKARRAWLLVAMTVPVAVMLALHQLARIFHVPGDSLLAWAGAACAALVMAGAAALGQARRDRPAQRRAGRPR